MYKLFIRLGAINGFLAVASGAFAAHALKDELTLKMLSVFQTGVQYQMYHALVLIAVGILLYLKPDTRLLKLSGWSFFGGIVIFTGSLMLLSLTQIKLFGILTPVGGLLFLCGWILLLMAVSQWKNEPVE
jgi:uncharacterized membrane protein YgdD (TMEM256/DUF423 family)